MVEIMTDAFSQFVDCVHAGVKCGRSDRLKASKGTVPMNYGMPEIYRHIFPESKLTHRIAKPYMSPNYVNTALCYGATYELEVRYLMDREFLENGCRAEWKEYARAVTELRRRHSDLLLSGRYSNKPDLEAANPTLHHGFFTAEDGSQCVVLWNNSGEEQPLDICGYQISHWENATDSGIELPTSLEPDTIIVAFLK